MSPTRRAGLAFGLLAVVLLALQNAWGIAVAVGAILAGVILADALAARRRKVEATRSNVGTIARGTEVDFRVDVTREEAEGFVFTSRYLRSSRSDRRIRRGI